MAQQKILAEVDDEGTVVAIFSFSLPGEKCPGFGEKVFLRDGNVFFQGFRTFGPFKDFPFLSLNWDKGGKKEAKRAELGLWERRNEFPKVKRVRKPGVGYSGGHTQGHFASTPAPDSNSVLSWDDSNQGAFTGFYPATVFLVLV